MRYKATLRGRVQMTPEEEAEVIAREAEWASLAVNRAKAKAFSSIIDIRQEKMQEGISQGSRTFELTASSKEWIDWARDYLTENPSEKVSYPGIGEIGAAGFQTLIQKARARVLALRKREADLYELILAATTVEELQAIDLNSGWD